MKLNVEASLPPSREGQASTTSVWNNERSFLVLDARANLMDLGLAARVRPALSTPVRRFFDGTETFDARARRLSIELVDALTQLETSERVFGNTQFVAGELTDGRWRLARIGSLRVLTQHLVVIGREDVMALPGSEPPVWVETAQLRSRVRHESSDSGWRLVDETRAADAMLAAVRFDDVPEPETLFVFNLAAWRRPRQVLPVLHGPLTTAGPDDVVVRLSVESRAGANSDGMRGERTHLERR